MYLICDTTGSVNPTSKAPVAAQCPSINVNMNISSHLAQFSCTGEIYLFIYFFCCVSMVRIIILRGQGLVDAALRSRRWRSCRWEIISIYNPKSVT